MFNLRDKIIKEIEKEKGTNIENIPEEELKAAVKEKIEEEEKKKRKRKKVLEYYKANIFKDIFTVIGAMTTFLLFASFFTKENMDIKSGVLPFSILFIIFYLIKAFLNIKKPFHFYKPNKIEEENSEFILKDNLTRRAEEHKKLVGGIFILIVIGLIIFFFGSLLDLFFS